MVMHFCDAEERPIRPAFDQHLIGITLEKLKCVPWGADIASGTAKVAAIREALCGDYAKVLITDHETAQ